MIEAKRKNLIDYLMATQTKQDNRSMEVTNKIY